MKSFFTTKFYVSDFLNRFFSVLFLLLVSYLLKAQKTTLVSAPDSFHKKVIAGAEYKAGSFHQWLWGKDYRKEWITPVIVPILNMDTTFGGLTPIKEGGGRQTKLLRLQDKDGRQYVLRSVNKTYTATLPEIVQGTFVEKTANDLVATNHPYAALTVPQMAEAAGIYHTNPRYFFVPYSNRLGDFNEVFANTLCLLEERPDETQIKQPTFGNPEDIVSTEKMSEKMEENNDHLMDQHFYLKTRLFDIFLGDWGRHKDNWRWARFDRGSYKIYRPVPKDRDQTYAKFEGFMVKRIASAAGHKEIISFDSIIKDIRWYNYPAIEIDKRFTNELTRQVWEDSAKALQQYLTDKIIEKAVQQMPPEIFAISGKEIISKLKSRRNHLIDYAEAYYRFLSKNIDIAGSKKNEFFEIKRLNAIETSVTVFDINKKKEIKKNPFYTRTFSIKETDEIRIYGIGGNDIFKVGGNVKEGILIRIIGGPDKDSLTDISSVGGWGHKTKYYDNPGNAIFTSKETKVYLSTDSAINLYTTDRNINERGIKILPGFNQYYRFNIGIGYQWQKYGWRKISFASQHTVGLKYSLTENSFHPFYTGIINQLFGRWNLNLATGYDAARRVSYYGTGNETVLQTNEQRFNWLRTKDIYGSIGLDQTFKERNNIALNFFYDAVKVINNEDRYVSKQRGTVDPSVFNWKQFIGSALTYSFINLNDPVIPTKGIIFLLSGSYTKNLKESSRTVSNFSSAVNFYLPLLKPFSLAIKTGAATQFGQPEFYQLNSIGGYYNLRGYQRYRFYGKTIFYNQNELRWLPSVKSSVFNGKIGLFALFDNGRVWNPGENSVKWHYGYGGGFLWVPFNKISAAIMYSVSKEDKVINLKFGTFF